MGGRILVIDDEELLTRTFTNFLGRNGYDVFVVKSGQHALDFVQEMDFDLIICDVRMPGLNGIQTISQIREYHRQAGKSSPPEIIISGYADEVAERDIQEMAPAAYIRKPFHAPEFLSKIRDVLRN